MFGGQCTHAKLAPQTPHPLAWDRLTEPASKRGEMLWGRQPFCPRFSSATEVCGWCDYTLPLFRILGLGVILAARCLWSRLALIIFFLHCWVTNGKHEGGWRGLALGAGWWWVRATSAAPTLSPSCGALSKRQKRPSGAILLRFSA